MDYRHFRSDCCGLSQADGGLKIGEDIHDETGAKVYDCNGIRSSRGFRL